MTFFENAISKRFNRSFVTLVSLVDTFLNCSIRVLIVFLSLG